MKYDELVVDPYEVLGISSHEATKEQISKAARKLGLKYHPDKNPSEAAHAKFLLVQKAKELLLDDKRRKDYDAKRDAERKRKAYEEQRIQGMNKRRKDFKADLEARVDSVMRAQNVSAPAAQIQRNEATQEELSRLREDGQRLMQQQRKEQQEQQQQQQQQKQQREEQQQQEESANAGSGGDTTEIRVKWRRTDESQSEDTLYAQFKAYGAISNVRFSGTKGTSAVVEFKSPIDAAAAVTGMRESSKFRVSLAERKKPAVYTHNFSASSSSSVSSRNVASNMNISSSLAESKLGLTKGASSKNANMNTSTGQILSDIKRLVDRQGLEARLRHGEVHPHPAPATAPVRAAAGAAPSSVAFLHASAAEFFQEEQRVMNLLQRSN